MLTCYYLKSRLLGNTFAAAASRYKPTNHFTDIDRYNTKVFKGVLWTDLNRGLTVSTLYSSLTEHILWFAIIFDKKQGSWKSCCLNDIWKQSFMLVVEAISVVVLCSAVSGNWGAPLNFWKPSLWGLYAWNLSVEVDSSFRKLRGAPQFLENSSLRTDARNFGPFWLGKNPQKPVKKVLWPRDTYKKYLLQKNGSKRPFQPSVVVRAIYISLFGVATAN